MNAPDPDSTGPIDPIEAERRRRQRSRNLAIFAVLAGIAVLVYAVTIVKIKMGWHP